MIFKYSYSYNHFSTAVHHAEEAKDLEERFENEEHPHELEEREGTALSLQTKLIASSVISATCCLEATINEYCHYLRGLCDLDDEISDALIEDNRYEHQVDYWAIERRINPAEIERYSDYLTELGLSIEEERMISDHFETFNNPNIEKQFLQRFCKLDSIMGDQFDRYSFIKKYQILLMLANEDLFEYGAQPLQDVNTINRIRNHLVHSKPSIRNYAVNGDVEHNLGSAIQGKFELNPLALEHSPYFPQKCFCYDMYLWYMSVISDFLEEFENKIGIPSPLHAAEY